MSTRVHRRAKRKPARAAEDITPRWVQANQAGEHIAVRSERAAMVARWFGLGGRDSGAVEPAPAIVLPPAGTITLLAGPSGSGKSRLLAAMRQQADAGIDWINLATLECPAGTPLVDCFGRTPLREILLLLARVGLGEAWTYLRAVEELSEGQRFRFKLALGLHSAKRPFGSEPQGRRQAAGRRAILVCDEFAAILDRVTAMVVARCLRRAIDAHPRLAAVVATSHDDLQPALMPDRIAWCDFGRVEWREMRAE